MATPTLKRSWGFVGCTSNSSDRGNNFKIQLEKAGPCVAATGDMLILGIGCPTSSTISITDDGTGGTANTWSQQVTLTGNRLYRIYTCSVTTTTGPTLLTIGFGGNVSDIQLHVSLYYNCATSSYTDGSAAQTVTATSSIASGSYTPAVNGDLIFSIVFDDASPPLGLPNAITSMAWGSGFSGLFSETNQYGSAAQYEVQATAGAINPTITMNQATHDQWAALSLAIKAGSGGAAPTAGMYILRSQMCYISAFSGATPVTFPTSGNLLVVANDAGSSGSNLSSVTDSNSNTYSLVASTPATYPELFHADNANTSNSLVVTLHTNSASGSDLIPMYDIVGAATAPLDTAATGANSSVLTAVGSGATKNTGTQGAAGATLLDAASITPSTAHGLIIDVGGFGQGPVTTTTGTSGLTYDYVSATWSTAGGSTGDNNGFGNGDFLAHYFNPNTSAVQFEFTTANTVASSWNAIAIALKAAPPATSTAFGDDSWGVMMPSGFDQTVTVF